MTTYVLVHGAWGGAHTWRTVRPLLWAAGHPVFTPALTGIGERAHLASPQIGLSTHVDDVVRQIVYEDLNDIVLLGFSYGGMVVTGALDAIGDRVGQLVYLDAFVPDDGQAVVDMVGTVGIPASPSTGLGSEWLIPPRERSFDNPAEAEFAGPRRTGQPIRTFTEPVRLARPLEEQEFGRTYIKATADPRNPIGPDVFWDAADRFRERPSWRYEEIDSNHMVPQNRPQELVDILVSLG
jgi:pimeloyl-ACP methyl ester carboxylesterase